GRRAVPQRAAPPPAASAALASLPAALRWGLADGAHRDDLDHAATADRGLPPAAARQLGPPLPRPRRRAAGPARRHRPLRRGSEARAGGAARRPVHLLRKDRRLPVLGDLARADPRERPAQSNALPLPAAG